MLHNICEPESYGPIYTKGHSFRARAEARQRRFRAETPGVGWSEHGHLLDDAAIAAGANFIAPGAFAAARTREAAGKGVANNTFKNMLSSQAMAFNIFTPLMNNHEMAAKVFKPFLPGLQAIRSITIEYTPPADLFRDQSGFAGVDCDLLIEATYARGSEAVIVIETKFVEPEMSICGFRKPKKAACGKAVCPGDVAVASSREACAYVKEKGYRYWEQTDALATLKPLPATGCPFGGPLWQLWVNHTLAHAEAKRRGIPNAKLLLCAPAGNDALLQRGALFAAFASLLTRPETFGMLPLDALLDSIATCVDSTHDDWLKALRARYAGI